MKRKKELIIILSSLLVIVLSVSVAYFTTKILGTEKDISVTSADLKVIFTSGSVTINGTNIEPGWTSGENTFTVKNESNGTYKYNIIIKDLVNTFVTEGFLQYKITSADGGYNMTDFADVPKSSTATDTTIAESISITKGTTHTYTVIFKYLESDDVDQSADMGKTLTGKIFITKGTEKPTLAKQLLNDNPTISTRNDFGTPFISNTVETLYKTTESGNDVYYFAGVDRITAHCEYNANGKLYEIEKNGGTVTREECSGTIALCDSYIWTGTEEECTDPSGQVGNYHQEEVYWIDEVSKPINNWVKFGGFYWRIIRTNADGSIRILYSGTSPDTTEGHIGEITFNTSDDSPKYVGYMYGDDTSTLNGIRANTNDSTIKTYIDKWYENNLTSFTNYLSNDAIYCNDREVGSGTYSATGSQFYYAAYTRLEANKTPTYDCTNIKDAFSGNNAEAKLKYPIALMTADEISYAGGVAWTASPIWYYTNSTYNSITGSANWWLLSPASSGSHVEVWYVLSVSPGNLRFGYVSYVNGVRPVTSLKSCVQWKSGDGSAANPYEIVENGGC